MKKSKAVTLKDIAQALGLSVKAVSTGLNGTGRLAPENRARIQSVARAMGYVPNAAARSLVSRRSKMLGVLVPFLSDSFFSRIVAGMEAAALEQDFSLLLADASTDVNILRKSLNRMIQRSVDALIVYPSKALQQISGELRSYDLPVVQIMGSESCFGNSAVLVDNAGGAAQAADYLCARGHREIGVIAHDTESPELRSRSEGFLRQCSLHGITCRVIQSYMSIEDSAIRCKALLKDGRFPGAVFAASDFAALGLLRTALAMNVKVPEELEVIGFDDLDIAAQQLQYPLSTVVQPKEEIGLRAVRMLIERINDAPERKEILFPQLKLRATTLAGARRCAETIKETI